MKLPSVENYRKDLSSFRLFAMASVGVALLSNALLFFFSQRSVREAHAEVWVIDRDHRPYLARVGSSFDYPERAYEYEEAVCEFYENAFSCDDTDFKGNLERALNLSKEFINGRTIKDYWDEENVIPSVLENNWTYAARCDSVLFDFQADPVKGYAFGKQEIRMRRQRLLRNMHFTFLLYDASQRTRKNPFAAKIDKIDIFNNAVISTHQE